MSFHFNPKLVTDSLIWAVDAANNTSYNGTSTTWNDLYINNQNLTLLSGSGPNKSLPVYSSNNLGNFFFNFTASTSYMSGSYAIDAGQNFSVGAWVYPIAGLTTTAGPTTNRGAVLNTSYDFTTGSISSEKHGWYFLVAASVTSYTANAYNFGVSIGRDLSTKSSTNTVPFNRWSYLVATIANSAVTTAGIILYVNGVSVTSTGTATATSPILYTYPTTTMGARYTLNQPTGQPDWFPWYIAASHIYNKVLTPQEVSQNYNAYKARFGLT